MIESLDKEWRLEHYEMLRNELQSNIPRLEEVIKILKAQVELINWVIGKEGEK